MERKYLIKCRLRRGLFEGEWIVRIRTITVDGSIKALEAIVYDESVDKEQSETGEEINGKLRVYVLEKKDNKVAVVLPQSTLENGPSVVVPEEELVEA